MCPHCNRPSIPKEWPIAFCPSCGLFSRKQRLGCYYVLVVAFGEMLSKRDADDLDQFSRENPNYDPIGFGNKGECDCGCGGLLQGRQRRWSAPWHGQAFNIASQIIRRGQGAARDTLSGFRGEACEWCGDTERLEVDHIVEVVDGGGACGLLNLRLLCNSCHKAKTSRQRLLRKSGIESID